MLTYSLDCIDVFFGDGCALQCHCLNGTCNIPSGICPDTRCQPGWIGEFCSKGKIHTIAALSYKLKQQQND